jgi:quercetin dioxygenase-like cupin family protein
MRIEEVADATYQEGEPSRFTGDAKLRYSLQDPAGNTLGEVHFGPRGRTNWHRHPAGQFIYVVSGRGRVRSRGGEAKLLLPGTVVQADPDEWHFHGADDASVLVHVVISGGATEWGDPVSDEEYDEGFRRGDRI